MNLPPSVDFSRDYSVYLAYDEDDWLLYAGCSKDVSARLLAHVKSGAWWTKHVRQVQAIGPMPALDAFELEAALIRRLAPLANWQRNSERQRFEADLWREQTEKHGTAEAARVIESLRNYATPRAVSA